MGGGTLIIFEYEEFYVIWQKYGAKIPVGSFLEVTGNKYFFSHFNTRSSLHIV